MKAQVVFLYILCIIILVILVGCSVENDTVPNIVNNNINVNTIYGDELRFELSSYANLHHQFISYKITLLGKNTDCVSIVLRDQARSVYKDPLSIFSTITKEDNISLYKLENNYVFVYNNGIKTYSISDKIFKGYKESDIIARFQEIVIE